MQYILL